MIDSGSLTGVQKWQNTAEVESMLGSPSISTPACSGSMFHRTNHHSRMYLELSLLLCLIIQMK